MAQRRRCIAGHIAFLLAALTLPSALQTATASASGLSTDAQTSPLLARPPLEWATAATANEIAIVQHTGSSIRYHEHFIDAKGDEVRDVIESRDGTVARLIRRNDQPLTTEQDQSERDRLMSMIDHPSEFHHHIKSYSDSKEIAISLLRLMPEAMIYTYAAGQPKTPESSAEQIVLDFAPNSAFHPPTTLSAALEGVRGRIWLDAQSKEVIRLEANIFQSINFGLALLAHIYPGGTVTLEQAPAVGSRWNLTHFNERVDMRFLMVKDLKVHSEVHTSDFQPIPKGLSYQDAIRELLNTPLPK